ncbi:hypothetical protein VNO77_18908 [Canavalia gladiata]|uniref:Uncharacterized protein n=1 Tax=Canavalia gladiata TaxID=3824 RepID=A0AAN9LRL6_CANGL
MTILNPGSSIQVCTTAEPFIPLCVHRYSLPKPFVFLSEVINLNFKSTWSSSSSSTFSSFPPLMFLVAKNSSLVLAKLPLATSNLISSLISLPLFLYLRGSFVVKAWLYYGKQNKVSERPNMMCERSGVGLGWPLPNSKAT